MRKLFACAAIAALAACSQPAPEPAADETTAAAPEPAADAGAPVPGDYTVTYEDGTATPFTMNADGTWSGTNPAGEAGKGTYTFADGKTCFTSDPPNENDTCWTASPAAADGTFSSVSDKGVTVSVKPAAAQAGETAAE